MKTSNDLTNLYKAQIALQEILTDVGKDKQGFGYRYASFDSIVQHLRPLLAQHGLGFIQTSTSDGDRIGVTTRLIHTSGEWVEDTLMMNLVSLAKMNDYQVAGSAITYLKRYGLSAIIGIAVDEDIDASGEKVVVAPNTVAPQRPPVQSKSTDDDKAMLWKAFVARAGKSGVDAKEILLRDGIDMTDKAKTYATVRQYMALNEDMWMGVMDGFVEQSA